MSALSPLQFSTFISHHEGDKPPVDLEPRGKHLERLEDDLLRAAAATGPDIR